MQVAATGDLWVMLTSRICYKEWKLSGKRETEKEIFDEDGEFVDDIVCWVVVVMLSAGCATTVLPGGPALGGGLVTSVTTSAQNLAVAIDPTASSEKVGKSSAEAFLGLFAFGDASVDAAMRAGGIRRVHHVDHHINSFLGGVWVQDQTIVHGEEQRKKEVSGALALAIATDIQTGPSLVIQAWSGFLDRILRFSLGQNAAWAFFSCLLLLSVCHRAAIEEATIGRSPDEFGRAKRRDFGAQHSFEDAGSRRDGAVPGLVSPGLRHGDAAITYRGRHYQ